MSDTGVPVLEVRNIAKQYPGVRALDGVDFDVHSWGGARPARPQRRGQVDADQVRLRSGRAVGGRDPRSGRAAADRRAVGVDGARRRDDLSGARPGRGPDGRRERVPRPRDPPRRDARPRRDAPRDRGAARAAGSLEHLADGEGALAAAGRPADRLDRSSAVAQDPPADHGRAVGDPRRPRDRDAVRGRPAAHRRGRGRDLHLAPPRRGQADRRPRDGALRRADGGGRAARRHAAGRAGRAHGRAQGRAALPGPREARRRRVARSARPRAVPGRQAGVAAGARRRGRRHRRPGRRRPYRAAAADLRPRPR